MILLIDVCKEVKRQGFIKREKESFSLVTLFDDAHSRSYFRTNWSNQIIYKF